MRASATGKMPPGRPAVGAAAALRALALAAVLGLTTFVAACGSGATKTVSVSTPAGQQASATGPAVVRPSAGRQRTAPTQTTGSSTGTSGAAQTTRTATAPAFAQQQPGGEGLDQALAVVKAHGFDASDTSEYHPAQTLRVLIGTHRGPAGGATQQAFFFVGGRFLGTDTSAPSGEVKVVGQSDTEVTLAYSMYRPHDKPCCATGGEAKVRFQLDNGRLAPLDPIPPASSSTGLSRQ